MHIAQEINKKQLGVGHNKDSESATSGSETPEVPVPAPKKETKRKVASMSRPAKGKAVAAVVPEED